MIQGQVSKVSMNSVSNKSLIIYMHRKTFVKIHGAWLGFSGKTRFLSLSHVSNVALS